jgi:hypothetical protein
MRDILIKKTPNADSRSIEVGNLDRRKVWLDTEEHIKAVKDVMTELSKNLYTIGVLHDHTKITYFEEFFDALSKHKLDKTGTYDIYKSEFWKHHSTERHHLKSDVPSDVNLFDVIEMIVDGVVSGKARTGKVYPIEIKNDILKKAVENTQKMIELHVKVED